VYRRLDAEGRDVTLGSRRELPDAHPDDASHADGHGHGDDAPERDCAPNEHSDNYSDRDTDRQPHGPLHTDADEDGHTGHHAHAVYDDAASADDTAVEPGR